MNLDFDSLEEDYDGDRTAWLLSIFARREGSALDKLERYEAYIDQLDIALSRSPWSRLEADDRPRKAIIDLSDADD